MQYFFCYNAFMEAFVTKVIVITSGKGGVGKTTVTANLGRALAKLGKRVVLIDLDFGLNNLDVVLGLENKVIYDMFDVFEGRCRLKQALVQDQVNGNLYILPSNSVNSSISLNGQNIKVMIEGLKKSFDYVLLDCPAGIDVGFHRAVSSANSALVVTNTSLPSIRDASRVVSILNSYRLDEVFLVVNRARGDLIINGEMMSPEDVSSILKINLLGVLPEEDMVLLSSGYSLPKQSNSMKAYKILANNLINNKSDIYDVKNKYYGFLGSIRRSLKKNI